MRTPSHAQGILTPPTYRMEQRIGNLSSAVARSKAPKTFLSKQTWASRKRAFVNPYAFLRHLGPFHRSANALIVIALRLGSGKPSLNAPSTARANAGSHLGPMRGRPNHRFCNARSRRQRSKLTQHCSWLCVQHRRCRMRRREESQLIMSDGRGFVASLVLQRDFSAMRSTRSCP